MVDTPPSAIIVARFPQQERHLNILNRGSSMLSPREEGYGGGDGNDCGDENDRALWIRNKEDVALSEMKEHLTILGSHVIDTASGEIIPGLVGIEPDISVKVTSQ